MCCPVRRPRAGRRGPSPTPPTLWDATPSVVDRNSALIGECPQEGYISLRESAALVGGCQHPEHTTLKDHGHDNAQARWSGGRTRAAHRVGASLHFACLDRTCRDAAPERSPQPAPHACCPGGGDDQGLAPVARHMQQNEMIRRQHRQRGFEDPLQRVGDRRGRRRYGRGFIERGRLARIGSDRAQQRPSAHEQKSPGPET